MERYLKDFKVDPKNPSEEAQRRWRRAAWLVKNPRRRFRFIADLAKRQEAERVKRTIQEKIRIALFVKKAALTFIDAGAAADAADGAQAKAIVPDEVKKAGFEIHPDELASIASNHDIKYLRRNGGVGGIARDLSVSITEGVSSSEVPTRQRLYGSNQYAEKPPRSFLMFVWDALQDLTLIILMVCAVVSIGVGIATEGWPEGMYDGLGIILTVFVVVIVTASSDYRQSLQFRDLDREKKKIVIQVTRDGRKQEVYVYDLVVGDIVELAVGDVIPADGIYVSGYGLVIDESSLSGESEPVNIDMKRPFLLAGTSVQDGSGKMLVTAVGMKTEWGKLMETLSQGGEDETPLQVKLNGVATVVGKIGLSFAVVTFLVLAGRFLVDKWLDGEIAHWYSSDFLTLVNDFAIGVTILVVAVPEGLPLAVTLSLAFAMKKLMSDMALVRHLSACETMGSASCICTDKTGTLTTNHMVVDRVWICGSAKDIVHESEGELPGLEMSERNLSILLQVIFLNTGCDMSKDDNGNDRVLGTPTDKAILEFGLRLGGNFHGIREQYQILKVEPFNSVRKKMSTLVTLPDGSLRAFCKGASEIVLKMCDKVVDDRGEPVHLSEEQTKYISDIITVFATEALRTLCLAYIDIDDTSGKHIIPEFGYTLVAIVGIKDPLRPGVRDAVRTCLAAGINVRMVTGDNINTAKAIARECGILTEDGIAIEGPDFRRKTPEEMMDIIPNLQVMARSLPLDKHTLVTALRKMGEVVAVTGDGTNDAPALHEADIGLAMGIAGTEVAKENADVIIMDDNFATIVNLAKWGRSVYINIQKFVQFQLTVNVVALVINFVSACITGSTPLTAVELLWVNMIMDTLGALALATEPPNDALMRRPPVRRGESFITRVMWRNIFGQSIYQLVVLGVLYFDGKRLLGLSGSGAADTLNTLIFNAFVFCQVFNEINSREMEKINVFRGIFSNWIFLGIIAITVIFQAIIVEFLGTFASTVPLSWQLWLLSIALGAVSLPIAFVIKCIPVGSGTPKHHDGYEPIPSGPDIA